MKSVTVYCDPVPPNRVVGARSSGYLTCGTAGDQNVIASLAEQVAEADRVERVIAVPAEEMCAVLNFSSNKQIVSAHAPQEPAL